MTNEILIVCVHEIKSVSSCSHMYTHPHIYVCWFCKPASYKIYAEESSSVAFTPQKGISDAAIYYNF